MNRRSLLVTAVAATLLSTRADAQPAEDPRRVQAEALFQEALKLHDRDREAEALERFEKAYALLPTANSLYWVAREEQLLGRSLASLRHYREALKNPLLLPKNAQLARQYIAELEPRFGRVMLKGPAGASVSFAGRQVRLPLEEAFDMDPGPIAVKGEREGFEYVANGTAEAAKTTVLELKPTAAPVEPPHEPAVSPSAARWLVPTALGLATVGSVIMGIGFASGSGKALDRANAESAAQGRPPCSSRESASCASYGDDLSTARADRTLSYIGYVGAFAFGAATLASVAFWPKAASTTGALRVAPTAGREGGGLVFDGSF